MRPADLAARAEAARQAPNRREAVEARRLRWVLVRVAVVALLLAAGFVAVAVQAVRLQVLHGADLARQGQGQWQRSVELKPRRGAITDRDGQVLAASADAPSIAGNPALLQALPRKELARLARLLGMDLAALEKKAARPAKFVWLARRVSPETARAVEALELEGVAAFQEARRYYTSKNLAAQLVGIVGDDGEGLEGIERAYDEALQGGGARVRSLRDARGRAVLDEAPAPGETRQGARVELAIDSGLQLAAEQALAKAVADARAAGGTLVAMDPRTGEVLALAHAPTFNPNAPRGGALMRNHAVLDTYEPGSTFKLFTLSGALDAGVLHPGDLVDCELGAYHVGKHVIHDHKKLGTVQPERILVTSSNIGAAKVGARLGRERLQRTLLAFGFGARSGTEIPGEPRGAVPYPRADIALATMSFGQGVAATPLQITTAVSAIANGGLLMKPILVRRVVDAVTGAVLTEHEPTAVRRAVSPETAALVRTWMRAVVDSPEGTGKRARIDGWAVAGKTGTAQKPDPVTRRYSSDRNFDSFVGFAPAEAPRMVIGVFIDEPKGNAFGAEVAAPPFREVMEHALKSLGVQPTQPTQPLAAVADADGGAGPDEGADAANDAALPDAESDALAEASADPDPDRVVVPALTGLPARAALHALEERELAPELSGTGLVASQTPAPGQAVARGAVVRLVLAPARAPL